MSFREVSCKEFTINPFTSLSTDAVLITAPDGDSVNPMTAAWGSYGYIWNKNAITVVVRPQRYTFGLMENTDTYTVAYFHNKRRDAMSLCGTQSGRDIDKMKECGFTMGECDGFRYIEEADVVFCCRKMYAQDMTEESFVDKAVMNRCYPERDFHRTYVGEVVKILVKE